MSYQKTSNLQPIPYLSFNGNCAEAMRFYEKTLCGVIRVMMTVADTPMAGQAPPGFGNRIMNAQLELPGGYLLYAGDSMPHMTYQGIHGISITLNYDSVEEAEAVFNALAEGGTVTMPYSPTFWAKKFGMLVDRYGLSWIINGVLTPV